ncbi:MAG: APC family permease [Gammaproteobacteria bacterium]|nr:APC family permease [Gammaproteobacteria bacterium]
MENKSVTKPKRLLSVFSLTMITVGAVGSIRNLPSIALFGNSLIFFALMAAILFLLPCTLISAELATTWPEQGGIYVWVKHAFGKRFGFIAVWFQWIENVFWYPTILSFSASTLAYLISPSLANNKLFLITVILSAFWGTTAINLRGMRSSSLFSGFCTIFGLILPTLLIIGLGALWYFSGKPMNLSLRNETFVPNLHDPQMWIALTGIITSFCGMEIATVHAGEAKTPHKSYPRALLISSLILVTTLIFSALIIALVLPLKDINILFGIMQIFQAFLADYNLHWIMPIIGFFVIVGCIGSLNNWIIAPTKSLSIAAKDGNLPEPFAHDNRFNAPHNILLMQGIIVTLLMLIFLLIPSVNGCYWLMTALTAQLYMMMYVLMFAAAIYLRFKHPSLQRPFRIPGKNFGIIFIGGVGIIGAIVTFVVCFIPPDDYPIGSIIRYGLIQVSGIILMSFLPLFIHGVKKIHHHRKAKKIAQNLV